MWLVMLLENGERGMSLAGKDDCVGCAACVDICPTNSIFMIEDDEGFFYPMIDEDGCILCNKCTMVCPSLNKKSNYSHIGKEAYVVIHKDDSKRIDSSSGGFFTLLSEYVLRNKGIIYGAVIDNEFNIYHEVIRNKDELKRAKGSKYAQSSTEGCFKEVKNYLEDDKRVLFTGTPCQIEGLKKFLVNQHVKQNRLITVDIACHGVSSNLLFKKYFYDLEKKIGSRIKDIRFREKRNGWRNWGTLIIFENGREIFYEWDNDDFMKIYLSHNAMRFSCYHCRFRCIFDRVSDFTMSDCWGIEFFAPDYDDDKGASMVFLQTDVSKTIWEEIKELSFYKKINIFKALQGNIGAYGRNIKPTLPRKHIYDDINKISFHELAIKYEHKSGIKEKLMKRCPKLHKFYRTIKFVLSPISLRIFYKSY